MSCSTNDNPLKGAQKTRVSYKFLLLALLLIIILVVSSAASAQSPSNYIEVKKLGTVQAICPKPGVQSIEELQRFMRQNQTLVEDIFKDADWQGNSQQLFDAIARGDVTDRLYTPGSTFEWMGMREKGRVRAQPKRVWAGESSFAGYEVSQITSCRKHRIVIPKICCNVSLAAIETVVDKPKLEATLTDRVLRVCSQADAAVSMVTPAATQALTLDENGCWSKDDLPDGVYRITASMECGDTEKVIEIAAPPRRSAPLGETEDKLAIVAFLAPFIGSESVMRFEPAWQMDKHDSSALAGVRGGLKIPLNRTLSLVPTLGAMHRSGINDGIDYPEDSASLDLGIEKMLARRFFIGAGIGWWNVDDGDFRESSVFVNTGGKITNSMEWFAELRGIDSDNDDGRDGFSDNHFYGGGMRFKF